MPISYHALTTDRNSGMLVYGSVCISERGKFLRGFFVVVWAILVACSFLFLGQPAHAQGRVSVQCGHRYAGQQLDFSEAHKSHREVDVLMQGANIAAVSCPVDGKAGGLVGRVSCSASNDYFDLETNSQQYIDCFGGFGYLSVYITQIDQVWWWQSVVSYFNYTPPGQHWYSCWGQQQTSLGENVGKIDVIDIGAAAGNRCPNTL